MLSWALSLETTVPSSVYSPNPSPQTLRNSSGRFPPSHPTLLLVLSDVHTRFPTSPFRTHAYVHLCIHEYLCARVCVNLVYSGTYRVNRTITKRRGTGPGKYKKSDAFRRRRRRIKSCTFHESRSPSYHPYHYLFWGRG